MTHIAAKKEAFSPSEDSGSATPNIAPRGHGRAALLGLCAIIGGSGVLHLVVPAPYQKIVPGPMQRQAGAVVALSGICEMACAALLLNPRRRALGAYITAALLVAVFPANVQMALDTNKNEPPASRGRKAGVWLRLPLQIPLILWALRFRHGETP